MIRINDIQSINAGEAAPVSDLIEELREYARGSGLKIHNLDD